MSYKSTLKIFILEDDDWYAAMLEHSIAMNPDYEVYKFSNEKDFFNKMHILPDVVTLDYSLLDSDGSKVLSKIKKISADIDVIVISGQKDVATAVNLLKAGAFDYIVKDNETKDRLWNALLHLQEIKNLKKEVVSLKNELRKNYDVSKAIIGSSDAMKHIFSMIEKSAKTNITVTITGETGTGKEIVAKAIHYNSARQKQPFVAINVAAIPKDLLESELFGHEKGAFTGAAGRRIGKFEEASKGTIFLDEIGEMDIHLQTKLLRVLQEREITRIGSNAVVPIDVRVIVATNKNLKAEVVAKNFREDLYYRLLGLPIVLPPLRERGNDILVLAKHFISNFCSENKIPEKLLAAEAKKRLMDYPFPGNVRELKSLMELAVVIADGNIIHERDIKLETSGIMPMLTDKERTLSEYEIEIVQHFLNKYQDVVTAAKKLGVGKSTIYKMIQAGDVVKK